MKKHAGFTLLELLVVMIIICIVASIAVLTIRFNPRSRYDAATQILVNAIRLAEQEAMLRPATLGLLLTPDAFTFYQLKKDPKTGGNQWVPIDTPALQKRALPAHTRLTL